MLESMVEMNLNKRAVKGVDGVGELSEIVRDFNNFPFNMNTTEHVPWGGKELVNYVQWSSWSLIARC
jgi:hypothetical protein